MIYLDCPAGLNLGPLVLEQLAAVVVDALQRDCLAVRARLDGRLHLHPAVGGVEHPHLPRQL